MGVKPGDRVGFLADNSRRWILTDIAIQLTRGISVPRGTDTPASEVADLFRHAEVGPVFVHDARRAKRLEEVRDQIPTMGEVICLDPRDAPGRTMEDLEREGEGGPSFESLAAEVTPEDVATIIYTSGTTGRPKGVVLTQANFGHQVEILPPLFRMMPDEVFLSILPPWHIFERTVEYAALAAGCRIAYTDRRHFRDDLRRFQPTFVPSVPRLWETVYSTVLKTLASGSPIRRGLFRGAFAIARLRAWGWDRARGHVVKIRRPRGLGHAKELLIRGVGLLTAGITWLPDRLAHMVVFSKIRRVTGGRLRGAISGGGHMPGHIDRFFRVIGVPILVGYGLTETSPVVAVRRDTRNVLGTIGTAVPHVEIQVRDLETGRTLPAGTAGIICTRGPQIMKGYHKDASLTQQVIDAEGWFDTGDLGLLTEYGDLCFRGRAKETIVLSGGENVEPSHVEDAILSCPLVSQAVVVGQDRKTLAALIVPEREEIKKAMGRDLDLPALAENAEVYDRLRHEVIRRTSGLKGFERVGRIAVLPEVLDVENGCLTQTMKPRRHVIVERFAKYIDKAYET
jgi:long-chain acyl-CoA synthetase